MKTIKDIFYKVFDLELGLHSDYFGMIDAVDGIILFHEQNFNTI
jgi:hypothetical protein